MEDQMRSVPICLAGAGIALALSAGAASASEWMLSHRATYVTSYRPETRYVRRTVVVRERVWRPVRYRVHYRRVYAEPYYGYGYGYGYAPRRVVYDRGWYPYDGDRDRWWRERRRAHEHWEHERWEHRGGYD
jgi:hypothetical protein